MPGTKAKQARALAENIKWMGEKFGIECLGFLTLTVGDVVNGRFEKVRERAEASRRFNSILNRIRERYRCGVVVTERHKDGGIHFHLVVVLPFDAHTGFDFEAVKRRDYRSVSSSLREEWSWWRETQERYGFGRHELLPIKSNGEAIGRYVAKYLGKSWEERTDDDYRGRCVRYFGRWSVDGVKCGPPWSARHGSLSPKASAWREMMVQIQLRSRVLVGKESEINEQNIKERNGPKWAWRITKQMGRVEFYPPTRGRDAVRQGIAEHNEAAKAAAPETGWVRESRPVGVWETGLDHWWREDVAVTSKLFVRGEVGRRRWAVRSVRDWKRQRALEHAFTAAQIWFECLPCDEQDALCRN